MLGIAVDSVGKVLMTRWREDRAEELEDEVVREIPLTIVVNGREAATLLCSPVGLRELTFGFLLSEGILTPDQPRPEVEITEAGGYAQVTLGRELAPEVGRALSRLVGSGCAASASFYRAADAEQAKPIRSRLQVSRQVVWSLMKTFQARSELYRRTGGVHAAALATPAGELVGFSEDIGRHNALDRLIGEAYLEGRSLGDLILLTSGRVSSEIVVKSAKARLPVLVSRAAPTDLAVALARKLNQTLVGFVRGRRLNVYSAAERIQ
jgi:FdhD protein